MGLIPHVWYTLRVLPQASSLLCTAHTRDERVSYQASLSATSQICIFVHPADTEGILYFDKRRWLWQFDIQEDRRYLYALPHTRNTTDLVDVLRVRAQAG